MPRFRLAVFVVLVVLPTFLLAQNPRTKQAKTSSSQALTFAAQAMAALTGGNSIADVTLTGSSTWIAGSDSETGSATLMALGANESRMDLALTSGTRTEIRDAQTGTTLGKWIAPSTASAMFAFYNCQTDAAWFFPALGSLSGGANVVFSYIGLETRNSESVQHIQSYVVQPSAVSPPGLNVKQLSTIDFYLDATTFLPSAVTFNIHPDNNAGANLLVEVDFSNYQQVSGITVPMHIQRYLQGTMQADLTISSAAFNTGIPLSEFSVN
jgi:hypothetical protein